MYKTSVGITLRVESDITPPVCVVLQLLVGWLGRLCVRVGVCESPLLPTL